MLKSKDFFLSRSLLMNYVLTFLVLFYGLSGISQNRSIINSEFEEPSASTQLFFNENLVPGWSTTDDKDVIEIWKDGLNGHHSPNNSQFVELNAFSFGALYQDVCMLEGEEFDWSFLHKARAPGIDSMRLLIDGVEQGRWGTGNTNWAKYEGSYTLNGPAKNVRFLFEAISTSTGNPSIGNFLESVVITGLQPFPLFDPNQMNSVEGVGEIPKLLINGIVATDSKVVIKITGGTATSGVDYTLDSDTVVVPAGEYDGTALTGIDIPITILDDLITEDDETIHFEIENALGSLTLVNSACEPVNTITSYTIIDDDCPHITKSICLGEELTFDYTYRNPDVVSWHNLEDGGGFLKEGPSYTYTPSEIPDTVYATGFWGKSTNVTASVTGGDYGTGYGDPNNESMAFNATKDFILESFEVSELTIDSTANVPLPCIGTH